MGNRVQTGLRINENLRVKLEAAAQRNELSFNGEIVQRLECSLMRDRQRDFEGWVLRNQAMIMGALALLIAKSEDKDLGEELLSAADLTEEYMRVRENASRG
jgi:hypothetical protein